MNDTPKPPTVGEAMTSPLWWGGWFAGEEWRPWRVFAAAAFGLSIDDPDDLAFYCHHTGRAEPPTERAREVFAIIGRRGGKTRTLAFIAAYLAAFVDWRPRLVPGERASVVFLAKDRAQAAIAFGYMRAFFDHPLMSQLLAGEEPDSIELRNRVVIQVATSSFRSIRGRTVCAALLDEIAFWFDEAGGSANPAEEVLSAIRPAMLTMPGSMLLVASSPYAKRGPLYEAHRRYWGQPGSRLVWHATTADMHPSIADDPDAVAQIAEERADDPGAAAAEYDAVFRDDVQNFLDRDLLQSLVVPGLTVRPPLPGVEYAAFVDANAGGPDSYAVAIGHLAHDGVAHVDCLLEYPTGTSPDAATAAAVDAARSYRITRAVGDNFAKLWTQDAWVSRGVAYDRCDLSRSDVYLESAARFVNGRVALLDNHRAINQIAALERRVHRGGRDSVGHSPGAHDDLANVICGLVYILGAEAAPSLWHRRDLLAGGDRPLPWPVRCVAAFASAAVDAAGIFVCFWALGADRYNAGPPLILIDYLRSPLTSTLFPGIASRLAALAAAPVPHPSGRPIPAAVEIAGIVCPKELQLHAFAAALECAAPRVLETWRTARPALLLSAAQQLGLGAVKVAAPAAATAQRLPLPLTEIRPDAPASAAADAVLLGIGNLFTSADLRRLAA